MANVTVQARISAELKDKAEVVLAAIGLTISEAIRLFMQEIVNCGGLPFQPTAKTPNANMQRAMAEPTDGKGRKFRTTTELFADWKQ